MSTADLVFGACLLIGGGLLLLTLIFDDLFGGILNAIHFGFDLGGVSPASVLLGFPARAARSRSVFVRRSESIWPVISVTGWKRPPTPPDSSVIGEKEKVNQVSSRNP